MLDPVTHYERRDIRPTTRQTPGRATSPDAQRSTAGSAMVNAETSKIRQPILKEKAEGPLQLFIDTELMEVVGDARLIFQEPVDTRLIVHGLMNSFGRCTAVGVKQNAVIDFDIDHAGIQPDGHNDSQIIGLLLGNVAGSYRIEDSVGNARLHRAHENIGVLGAVDGDFANHHSHGADLNITIQDGEHSRVSLGLVTNQVGNRVADRPIKLANDDFRFCSRVGGLRLDECFTGFHDDALCRNLSIFFD